MSWRRQLSKLSAMFRRGKPADDLAEEIRSHLAMEEEENLESGMAPGEPHYAALQHARNDPELVRSLEEQIRRVSSEPLGQVPELRNPFME